MSVGMSCGHLERGVCLRCENVSLRAKVERLTTERDVRQQYGDRMKDERDEALDEVERLREALSELFANGGGVPYAQFTPAQHKAWAILEGKR